MLAQLLLIVEWNIPVGCGFSGFFCEFLPLALPLGKALPELRLVSGECADEFYDRQLAPTEAKSLRFLKETEEIDAYQGGERGVPSLQPPEEVVLWDTDLPGGDLPRSARGLPVNSSWACHKLCDDRPACRGWTFREQPTGMCWLKARVQPSVKANGLVSGVLKKRGRPVPRVVVWHGRCSAKDLHKERELAGGEVILVARLMTESATTRNTPGVLECANAADEVWVPTQFHMDVLKNERVATPLFVIPEAVDPDLFSPSLSLSSEKAGEQAVTVSSTSEAQVVPTGGSDRSFVFASSFKWERRKGWDLLLDAYWTAFTAESNVLLRLRTWKPPWERGDPDLDRQIRDYAWDTRGKTRDQLARVEWMGTEEGWAEEFTREEYVVNFLRQADAFVLPTRGEGWCLPVAEAMTLGLPTIVTNWSGPTAFATADTAFLLPVLPSLDSRGFSRPDPHALVDLMQRVHLESTDGSDRAKSIGERARAHMMRSFSPGAVAATILDRLGALSGETNGAEAADSKRTTKSQKTKAPLVAS